MITVSSTTKAKVKTRSWRAACVLAVLTASCGGETSSRLDGSVDGALDADPADARDDSPGVDGAPDAPGDAPVGADAGPPPPSCMGLANTCGPNMNESCCATIAVPGGTFKRSFDAVDYIDPSYPATLSAFSLDRFEVTVGRFKKFVAGYPLDKPAKGAGKNTLVAADQGWDMQWDSDLPNTQNDLMTALSCGMGSTFAMGSDVLPINCTSWFVAAAFCAWDGGFLPTEAQWNYAAVGGSEQRVFPWSNPPTQKLLGQIYAVYNDSQPRSVGSRPMGDGRWGHADLVGNVLELHLDWYVDPFPNPCNDCANLTPAMFRTNRAGHFQSQNPTYLSPSFRNMGTPTDRAVQIGLRCARK